MNKEKHLNEVIEILNMANTAFSDDYLTKKEVKEDKKDSFKNKLRYREEINKIQKQTQKTEPTLSAKLPVSPFSEKNYFELEKIVLNCTKCIASSTRNSVVFGKGEKPAKLMVIGEGPGKEEDARGDLFVGKSGQYLYKWLHSINVNVDSEVYFTNIVKCFSGSNPTQEIVDSCLPYLERQIELVNPKVILILGKIAANNLFKNELSLNGMREKIHTYKRIPCIVTYHPAAVLRNPTWRRPVWEDLKKVKQLIKI